MSNIASLEVMSDSLDTAAKLIRVLGKEGVSLRQILLPINDRSARTRFVEFLKADCKAVLKKPCLLFRGEISVGPLTKRFDPNEFFCDEKSSCVREGLGSGFYYNEMPVVESADAVKLRYFDLARDASDRQIKGELPEKHNIETWQIAALTDAQRNGESGPLLADGSMNIFYIDERRVYAYYSGPQWSIDDTNDESIRVSSGSRVFSLS